MLHMFSGKCKNTQVLNVSTPFRYLSFSRVVTSFSTSMLDSQQYTEKITSTCMTCNIKGGLCSFKAPYLYDWSALE